MKLVIKRRRCFVGFGVAALLCAALGSASAASATGTSCPGSGDHANLAADADLVILAEGDSITAGVGASEGSGSYVTRALALIDMPRNAMITATTRAILGWTGPSGPPNSLYSRMDKDIAIIPSDKKQHTYVLSILIGRNDLVGYYGGTDHYLDILSDYIARMKAAGWDKVVLGTLLPSDWSLFGPVRAEFNKRVLAPCWAAEHGVDAIADFSSIGELSRDEASRQKMYFVDGIHPSDLGYELMAPVYAGAINSLRKVAPD